MLLVCIVSSLVQFHVLMLMMAVRIVVMYNSEPCPICHDTKAKEKDPWVLPLCCGHALHQSCLELTIESGFVDKCTLCQRPVAQSDKLVDGKEVIGLKMALASGIEAVEIKKAVKQLQSDATVTTVLVPLPNEKSHGEFAGVSVMRDPYPFQQEAYWIIPGMYGFSFSFMFCCF